MHAALLMALFAHADTPADNDRPDGIMEVHRALSARDNAAPCEQVEALSTEPVQALLYIVDNATQPPWAGIRAAECLTTRHAEQIQPQLKQWVQTPGTKGFALIVFNNIDRVPEQIADTIIRAALAGPLAEDARPRLQSHNIPRINSIIEETSL